MDIAEIGLRANFKEIDAAARSQDRLSKSSRQMESAAQRAESQYSKFTDNVERGGKKVTAAERAVSMFAKTVGVLAIAFAGFVGAAGAIDTIADFGASVSNLSAITGAAGKDLEFYKEQAKEIGRTTTLSASQATTAFKLIASGKPELLDSAESLNAVTREAVTLAEAAAIDLPEAAKALTSSLNQFGAGADQASRFINVLAAGAKFGSSEIADATLALRDSGTVASSAGISFESLNASIQILAANSITGSRAGVALRNILSTLQNEADAFNPAVVGMNQALINLKESGFDENKKALALFKQENFVAAQTLISSAERQRDLTNALTGTSTAYDQAAINVDNLRGDIKQLQSAFEGLQLSIGSEDALRTVFQALTASINAVSDNAEGLGEVLKTLAIVYTATLIPAITRTTVAMTAQAAFMIRYAGVSGAATLATQRLAGAMSILGGLAGVLAGLVGFGLLTAYRRYSEEVEEAGRITDNTTLALERARDASKEAFSPETVVVFNATLQQINREIEEAREQLRLVTEERRQNTTSGISVGPENGVQRALKGRIDQLNELQEGFRFRLAASGQEVNEYTETLNLLRSGFEKLGPAIEFLIDPFDALKGSVKEASDEAAIAASTLGEESKKAIDSLIRSLDPAIAREQDLAQAQELLNKAVMAGAIAQDEYNRLLALARVRFSDAAEAADEAEKSYQEYIDQLEEWTKADDEAAESLQRLIDRLEPANAAYREMSEAHRSLDEALKNGVLTQDRYNELVAQLPELIQKGKKETDEFTKAVERGIERLDDIGSNFWRDLFEGARINLGSIKDLFLNTLAEMAHAAITRPVILQFAQGGGIAGGIGQGLSGIRDFLFGQQQDPGFVGPPRPGALAANGVQTTLGRAFSGGALGLGVGLLAGDGLAGSLGGLAGGALGSTFLAPLLSSLGQFAGPVASILSGFVGSFIGSLFSKSPRLQVAGGDVGGLKIDDRSDSVIETALGTVQIDTRKLGGADFLNQIAEGIREFDSQLATILGSDNLPAATEALRRFSFQAKGKNIDPAEVFEARFRTITQSLGSTIDGIVNRVGSSLEDRVQRLSDVLAIDEFISTNDILGNEINQAVTLLDELGAAGETLGQTFERVVRQTELFKQAVDLLGLNFQGSGDDVVKTADALSKAFGGLDQFTAALEKYQNVVGASRSPEDIASDAAQAIDVFNRSIGLSGDAAIDSVDELRRYTQALDLTTDEGRQAFKSVTDVAESIGIFEEFVNDLGGRISEINEFSDSDIFADYAEGLSQQGQTLTDLLRESGDAVRIAREAYDGSLQSATALQDAVRHRYALELQFLQQIDNVLQSTLGALAGTRRTIEESLLDANELYERRRQEIRDLADQVGTAQSPEELQRIGNEINNLTRDAFGLLSENQRRILGPQFLEFIDTISSDIAQRTEEFRQLFGDDALSLRDQLSGVSFNQALDASISRFDQAVTRFEGAVNPPVDNSAPPSSGSAREDNDSELVGRQIGNAVTESIRNVADGIATGAAQAIQTAVGNITIIVQTESPDRVNA